MTKAHYKPRSLMSTTCNLIEAPHLGPTIGPHFSSSLEPDASASSETIVVDMSHLTAIAAKAPPYEEANIEFEIANTPLPAAQTVGGYVISAEYMRRIMVYARRERIRRLGIKHL